MKTHVAALALVVWYLMRPPLPHLNAQAIGVAPAAPLSRWTVVGTFPTQKECDAHQGASPRARCVSDDDRRLKGNKPQEK